MGYLGRPIIAIDYDGTIRKGKRQTDITDADNELMPNCKKIIENLFYDGCRLILWCGREDLNLVRLILEENDILQYFEEFNDNVKEIRWWNTRKIYADYYIDDLNLGGFPGWEKAYEIILDDSYYKERIV